MIPTFEKDPSEALDYTVEFEGHCARVRQPGTAYGAAVKVRPARATGLQYSSSGGVTGTAEPRWPTTVGATVKDGSITWTAEAIAVTSLLRTLSSTTWTADTGVTVSGKSDSGTRSTAIVSGGALGQSYLVRVDGTFSDSTIRTGTFVVKIARPRTVDA